MSPQRSRWYHDGLPRRSRDGEYHRRHHKGRSSLTDLVSDLFSISVYDDNPKQQNTNSLMRQSKAHLNRMERSSPHYDIDELDDRYELTMEVPGMDASDLSVELEENDLLRISGTRRRASPNGEQIEMKFDQTFSLEDVDTDNLKVTLSNGLLRISAPKKVTQVTRLTIEQEEPTEDDRLQVNKTVMEKVIRALKEKAEIDDRVAEPVD